jgi:hypothetical protein
MIRVWPVYYVLEGEEKEGRKGEERERKGKGKEERKRKGTQEKRRMGRDLPKLVCAWRANRVKMSARWYATTAY